MTHPHTLVSPGSPWLLWYCPCVGTSQSPQYECLPKVWHWSAGCSGAGEDRLWHINLNSSDSFHQSWTLKTIILKSKRVYFKIQVHHAVPVQESHSGQDLLGQPDHILLCKGLVVICHALVEDFSPSSTVNTEGVRKVRTWTAIKWCTWPSFKCAFLSGLADESWQELIPATLLRLTNPKSFPVLWNYVPKTGNLCPVQYSCWRRHTASERGINQ